jgi:flagellar operon protein (TIGR03826 family)
MDVKACKKCGRLFNYLSGPPICSACRDELEKKFAQVKEYIRENPRASMKEISEENDVPQQQLQQWVREERLEFTSDSPIQMTCESCGKRIQTGRFCESCKGKMASGLTNAFKKDEPKPVEKPKKKDGNHMRFMNKD